MSKKDFLKELGFLGFVTRLKRVSDAMLHDGRRLYKELGMEIEPNWYVVFKLLQKHGELTVTEIADKIGFAHPSVITIVNKMVKAGYLQAEQCSIDSRRRLLVLTEKAKKEMPDFERVWSAVTTGAKKMLADTDALAFLDLLESRIVENGFKERTLSCLKDGGEVEIIKFKDKYADDFARLNYEWIDEFFEIEKHDREQLNNPKDHIIETGGQIFYAKINDEIVGTVALIKTDNNTFELAKMAVTSKYRGYKVGDKLMAACIEYAEEKGSKQLYLESNTKLIPALRLYQKFGFKKAPLDSNTPFKRTNIRMKLHL